MTLKELEDRVLEHFNYQPGEGETKSRLRIRRHLNTWHRRVLTMPMFSRLRETTVTFPSTAGQPEYGLRQGVARILRIYERTNDQVLTPQSIDWYRQIEPDPQRGTPCYWIPVGERATWADPSSTGLWVVSTSVSDTAVKVHLQGVAGSDQVIYDDAVTLTGTTRVRFGTEADFHVVSKFYLEQPALGTVDLYGVATAGSSIATIEAGATYSRYQRFLLWPTPAAADTFYLDCELAIRELYTAYDEPMLPSDFHDLLELGARIEEYEKENDTRMASTRVLLARRLSDLMAYLDIRPGYVGVPGEMAGVQTSRLGPWFPAGS